MTQPGDNKKDVLEEFLSGDSGLSRAYQQQAKEEPSNAVDETLRAAARRELNSGPRHIINPFGHHWTVPASLAAMFLLSIGLVIFLSDETGVSPFQNDVLEETLIEQEMAPSVGASSFEDSSAPAPSAGSADRLQKNNNETIKKQSSVPAQPVDSRKRIESGGPERMMQKSRARQEGQGLTSDKATPQKPEAKTPGVSVPALQMEMDAPAESTALTPELWLQKIRNLRKQGKTKEADASLAQFRKVYPDYPLDILHK